MSGSSYRVFTANDHGRPPNGFVVQLGLRDELGLGGRNYPRQTRVALLLCTSVAFITTTTTSINGYLNLEAPAFEK